MGRGAQKSIWHLGLRNTPPPGGDFEVMGHPTTGTSSWADGWGGPCNHRTQLWTIYTSSPPPTCLAALTLCLRWTWPGLLQFSLSGSSEALVSSSLFLWAYFFSFFLLCVCVCVLSHMLVLCFPLFSPYYFASFSSDLIGLFHLLCMPLSLSVFLLLLLFLCLPVTLLP